MKTKRLLVILLLATPLFLVSIVFFWGNISFKKTPPSTSESLSQSFPFNIDFPSTEESLIYTENVAKKENGIITSSQSPLSYTEALELYKGSILEFNDFCQTNTRNKAYPYMHEIMIDNRSSKERVISVGSVSVSLNAYDFGFIVLKEQGSRIPINCEGQQNVAFIAVK